MNIKVRYPELRNIRLSHMSEEEQIEMQGEETIDFDNIHDDIMYYIEVGVKEGVIDSAELDDAWEIEYPKYVLV